MSRGTVHWYSETLGYGFIETSRGDRVLVRSAAIDMPEDREPSGLREGIEVEFSVGASLDGVVEARHVTPVS